MVVLNASAGDFAEVVQKYLNEYGDECSDAVVDVIPKVAKDAAKKLQGSSPKRTGKYAKGWTSKVQKSRTGVTAYIYGKSPTYRLAHLLEFGHAKRNGGRVAGNTHIAPVEAWAIDEATEQITEKIGAN